MNELETLHIPLSSLIENEGNDNVLSCCVRVCEFSCRFCVRTFMMNLLDVLFPGARCVWVIVTFDGWPQHWPV